MRAAIAYQQESQIVGLARAGAQVHPGPAALLVEAPHEQVVFARDGDKVKMVPVKTGISDSDYFEISEGLTEGQEIVVGNNKAINKDLEDGLHVKFSTAPDAGKSKP